MSRRGNQDDSGVVVRKPPGMGLAARFTLFIGLATSVVAAVATWLLLQKTGEVTRDAAQEARLEIAYTTGRLRQDGAKLPDGSLTGRSHSGPQGVKVLETDTTVSTNKGSEDTTLYRVVGADDPDARNAVDLFSDSAGAVTENEQQLLVFVLMITGGMLLTVIVLAGFIGRRVASPVRAMIEDVGTISRGRLDHRIRSKAAVGEVAHLARAVDRMVAELVEGQESRRELEKRQREVQILKELRRNLKPMTVEAPSGFSLETHRIEARGAGSGDFVDALSDEQGRATVVVGGTATKGMAGALLMAMTRAYLRGAVLQGSSPSEAGVATNASLNRDLARGLFSSAMIARLDPSTAELEMVSAGHSAPAVRWDAEHGQFKKLQPNGIALGFDEGPIFQKSLETLTMSLGHGDAVFLFSPATFEEQNAKGQALGEKGVYALAKIAVEQGLGAMEQKLSAFLGGAPSSDLAFALVKHHAA